MIQNGMRPVHPGEILFEEFMKPAEPPINANMLAKALEVPRTGSRQLSKGSEGLRAIPRCVWRRFSIPQLSSG